MLVIKGLQRTQRCLIISSLSNCRNGLRSASAAAAQQHTPQTARDQAADVGVGVPVHEGPSTSVPSGGERVISQQVQQLVDRIASLSLLEVSDLNYALKKRLNIPDQPIMPMGAMMMGMAASGATTPQAAADQGNQEEDAMPTKTSFTLKLQKYDDSKKIALIKEMRACMPNMNLVQAKKFIESAPVEVKTDIGHKEAEDLKTRLEAQGATYLNNGPWSPESSFTTEEPGKAKADAKGSGNNQKAAAAKALTYKCTVCMAQMPDPKTYKQHFESKHPKSPLPPELVEVQA